MAEIPPSPTNKLNPSDMTDHKKNDPQTIHSPERDSTDTRSTSTRFTRTRKTAKDRNSDRPLSSQLKSIRLRARRSPSIPSHLITKSKKGKRKSSSSKKAVAEEPEGRKEPSTSSKPARNTQEYVKEIGTINHIIKSVVNPVTATEKGQPLIEGIVRPLSAEELGQLLKSIGNVATIHENIDVSTATTSANIAGASSEDAASSHEGKSEKRRSKSRKSKNRRRLSSSQKSIKLSNYLSLIKEKGASGTSKGVSDASGGKLSKEQMLINSKASTRTKSAPHPPQTARSSVKKLKSMKSQVKALIKEQISAEKSKSKTKRGSKRRSKSKEISKKEQQLNSPGGSEAVESVMSDLDLIKSAILNKRYYEESMALAHSNSKDNVSIEGALKKTKKKSPATGKKVSYASAGDESISPSKSDASIGSRLEQLRDIKKKTENTERTAAYFQSTLNKLLKDEKAPEIRPPTTGTANRPPTPSPNKKQQEPLQLVQSEADNKKHLKDVLVNYSHVLRGPDPAIIPNYNYKKDFQFSEDGELYFTQRILTAPRFNAMSAELHDDNTKFKEHIEKTKSIQKRFGPGGTEEVVTHGTDRVSRTPLQTAGKEAKKHGPVNTGGTPKTPTTSKRPPKTAKPMTNDRNKLEDKIIKVDLGTDNKGNHQDTINELFSLKNALQKNHKEPVVKSLAKAHSLWQQQSLYPSAYPSVVNTVGSGGVFDKEERWSTLNQKTMKKNEELKDQRVESGDLEDITRRMHPATPKKYYEVDDENKILDSFATYMKVKGNSRPTTAKNTTRPVHKKKV